MLLCATTTPGCLLGPPVEGLPEEELHAPRIARDQLDPGMTDVVEVELPEQCREMHFKVKWVSDENVDDILYIRWFVDWSGPASIDGLIREPVLEPTGEVNRQDEFRLTYQLNFDSPPKLLDPLKPHTVTLVVADRVMPGDVGIGFSENEDGQQEGQYDIYQWTFFLTSGGLCSEPRR